MKQALGYVRVFIEVNYTFELVLGVGQQQYFGNLLLGTVEVYQLVLLVEAADGGELVVRRGLELLHLLGACLVLRKSRQLEFLVCNTTRRSPVVTDHK